MRTQKTKNMMMFGLGLLLVSGLLLIGCSMFDEDNSDSPTTPALEAMNATYGHEGGAAAQYQPGSTPGIEILADFAASKTHKEGKPWGDWTVDAYWRREARTDVITAFSLPFTIDDKGQGRTLIPAWFLNAVFADAAQRYQQNGDTSTWHHSPGLYLQILPVGDTEDYYDFDPNLPEGWTWNLNSWAFAGSLEALTQALGLGWWPGLKALVNVSVSLNISDPIGTEQQAPVTSGGAAGGNACTAKGYTQFKCATADSDFDQWDWDGHAFTLSGDGGSARSTVNIRNNSGANADSCFMNDWWQPDGQENTNDPHGTVLSASSNNGVTPRACLYIKPSP